MYVDSSVIMGMTGDYNPDSVGFDGMEYMPCSPSNDFFPDLAKARWGRRENCYIYSCVARLLSAIRDWLLRVAMSLLSRYADFCRGDAASTSADSRLVRAFLLNCSSFLVLR